MATAVLHVKGQIRIAIQIDVSVSEEALDQFAGGVAEVVARLLAVELDVHLLEEVILKIRTGARRLPE